MNKPNQPLRILLVDDDRVLSKYHAAILENAGFSVHHSIRPSEALAAFPEIDPDLLIVDYHMPEMTGPELVKRIRATEAGKLTVALLITADHHSGTIAEALRQGVSSFLMKPLDQELFPIVCQSLASSARTIKENTAYLRGILDSSQDAIISIDEDGNVVEFNPAAERLFGYAREQAMHRQLYDLIISPAQREADEAGSRQAGDPENINLLGQSFELSAMRANGEEFPAELAISTQQFSGITLFTCTLRDISERKRNENMLREGEQRLRNLLKTSPIAVQIVRLSDRRIVFVNRRCANLFHTTLDKVLGSDPVVFYKNQQDYKATYKNLEQFETITEHLVELVTLDGHPIWALASYEHTEYEGEPAVLGWFYDVTALRQAKQQADNANRAKSDFLSSMSHELRTPMNAILGFGQLLEYDGTLSPDQQENVQAILSAAQHLLQLINEVLDLAKIESGRISLSPEAVQLAPLVEECFDLVGTLASKRGITLSHISLWGAVVRADRTRLMQVLLNLLSNAIKYNHEGGSVRIEVQLEGEARLCIRVIDSGPGIPADQLAELFQPFNRLGAENSEIEGTGIGLTITRRIMELMGGTVDVKSEVGVGSTFWVELPCVPATGSDHRIAERRANSKHHANSERRSKSERRATAQHNVLYIEDNPVNINLVARILDRRQHVHLLTAHTPELGIELALTRHPALILLDINLPGMDGYQVLEVLKADASLKAIPVIAVTANVLPHDIERGKAAGFANYLTKPLNVETFLNTIDRYLQDRKENAT